MNESDIVDKAQNILQIIQRKIDVSSMNNDQLSVDSLKKRFEFQRAHLVDEYSDTQIRKVDNLAVVIGFWGIDAGRISATTRAISYLLRANPAPQEIVLVEAQEKTSDAVFKWTKRLGVKYLFRKIPANSIGLLLKTALWNIGASQTACSKLCFIDSDIVFCNQDWISDVSDKLECLDVVSPFMYAYYEGRSGSDLGKNSIGWTIQKSNQVDFSGHPGFGIAMTRSAYEYYGRFEAFSSHDDMWIWHRITGQLQEHLSDGWMPYKSNDILKRGLPLRVGSSDKNICCHLQHGEALDQQRVAEGLVTLSLCKSPFEDIVYDPSNPEKLPSWSEKVGDIVKCVFMDLKENSIQKSDEQLDIAMNLVGDHLEKKFGCISQDRGLVIVTAVRFDFKNQDFDKVRGFRDRIRDLLQRDFQLICISNVVNRCEDIDFIPFSSKTAEEDQSLWKSEMTREDIVFPSESVVVYAEFSNDLHGIRIFNGREEALTW